MKTIWNSLIVIILLLSCSSIDEQDQWNNYSLKKGIVLGNSITVHDINDYWWGVWGMAASCEENDFVHRLESKIRQYNPDFCIDRVNIAQWENSLDINVLDLTALTSIGYPSEKHLNISDYDLIIIRLGENIDDQTERSTCENAFKELVDNIKARNASAQIYITGVYWPVKNKEKAIKSVAASEHIPYIRIDKFYTSPNLPVIGDKVYGNDGQLHTIDNKFIIKHPNDAGMEAIAEEIFRAIRKGY